MNFKTISNYFRPTHPRVRLVQYSCHLGLILGLALFPNFNYLACGFLFFLVIHGLGSGCGVHRYWSHNSFSTSAFFEWTMGILFTLSSMGSVIGYVIVHRNHHANSDNEKDPHNPYNGSVVWAWLGFFDRNNLKLNPKMYLRLMKDKKLAFLHNYYFLIILTYVALLILIDPVLLIYFYALQVVLQFHVNSILIVLAHSQSIGYQSFETNDNSKNLPWFFKLICLGEELHNNHHKLPSSPTMNLNRTLKEFDPLEYVIKFILDKNSGVAKWI